MWCALPSPQLLCAGRCGKAAPQVRCAQAGSCRMRAASCTAIETIPPCRAALVKMCLLQPDTPPQTPAFRQTPKVIILTGVTQVVCQSYAPAPASLQTCPHWGECPRVQPCSCSASSAKRSTVLPRQETPDRMTHRSADSQRAHSSPAQCATCVRCMSGLASAGHKPCRTGMARVRCHATCNACPSQAKCPCATNALSAHITAKRI